MTISGRNLSCVIQYLSETETDLLPLGREGQTFDFRDAQLIRSPPRMPSGIEAGCAPARPEQWGTREVVAKLNNGLLVCS